MNVLSLFDGLSGGQIALNRAEISYDKYFASEIDKYAIIVTQANYPSTIQLGDITSIKGENLPNIDLLIGGSPCQSFSVAGDGSGFDGKSKLFWEYIRLLKETTPTHFLLENVKMKKEWRDIISAVIGVEPIEINSALVSAQNRVRNYWTNISTDQPEDKKIFLKDIVLNSTLPVVLHNIYGGFKEKSVRVSIAKSPTIRTSGGRGHIPSVVLEKLIHSKKAKEYMNRKTRDGRNHWDFKHHSDIKNEKSTTVVSNFFKGVPYNVFKDWSVIRKFHPIECERLQTIPDNYTEYVSNTQRYSMIGNSFTIDVIAHILRGIK